MRRGAPPAADTAAEASRGEGSAVAWRVFPWAGDAAPDAPYSAAYVYPRQGSGRFDLDGEPLVLYLAETAAHAVGEVLQAFRGRTVGDSHLRRHGRPLALVQGHLPAAAVAGLADLTDPRVLMRLGLRPDVLASHDRQRTQAAARTVHQAGHAGFRWWSSLTGEWHTLVLFLDRVPAATLVYGLPAPLALEMPAVREAAALLGIGL